MKATLSQLLVPLLTLLLAAGVTWWWYANMEKRWEAQVETSEQAVKNPMLAATRLLTRHRHAVTSEETLSRALTKPLPSGTLILAGNSGVMTMPQVRRLLDWVARGNTLIASPLWEGEEDQQVDRPANGEPAASKRVSPFRRNAAGLASPVHAGLVVEGMDDLRSGLAVGPSEVGLEAERLVGKVERLKQDRSQRLGRGRVGLSAQGEPGESRLVIDDPAVGPGAPGMLGGFRVQRAFDFGQEGEDSGGHGQRLGLPGASAHPLVSLAQLLRSVGKFPLRSLRELLSGPGVERF